MSALKGVVKRRHWFYNGDVNIEHGGFFYDLSTIDDGYVDSVHCTACSDAGGPGNCWWVEKYSIVVDKGWKRAFDPPLSERERAHRVLHDLPMNDAPTRVLDALTCLDARAIEEASTWAKRKHLIVYALVSYGVMDKHADEMVRIGPPDPFYSGREGKFDPDVILRAGSNLRRYVRGLCH